MAIAMDAAREAAEGGEVPVGAVVMRGEDVVAVAANATRSPPDPTGHAEMRALRMAAQALGQDRLTGCDLYVTLEPCAMCAAAIAATRLARVVYGASDPKSGGVAHGARVFSHPQAHHAPEIIDGVRAAEAETLLRDFFARRR